jgi:single-strand DNA-binding protein
MSDATFCKIEGIFRLGSKPEMRYSPSGKAVTNFSAAANQQYKTAAGEQVKEVTWIRVSCWGRLAEIVHQYLDKGQMVYIEGRLTPDKSTGGPRVWNKDDGTASASFEVTASTVRFLSSRGEGDQVHDEHPAAVAEDDIPF